MAFQTGTATSFINLLDALRLFATANGWTQNGWAAVGADQRLHLQKGTIYANFLGQAAQAQLKGSLGYNGASTWDAQPSTHAYSPKIRDGWYGAVTWPVTYWFFLHTAPDSIEVVIRYQPTRYLWLTFGAITKYGTWPGGEFFCASSEHPTVGNDAVSMAAQIPGACNYPGLFVSKLGQFGYYAAPDIIHAEIDTFTWGSATRKTFAEDSEVGSETNAGKHAYPLPQRSQSAFNGLTTLQPIELYMRRPDAHYSPLGRIEHARYAIVTNHNAADIIDIGGQKWMLFPWVEKGSAMDASGQHYGWAIKYDGP